MRFDIDTFKAMMKTIRVEGVDPKYFTKADESRFVP